MNIPREKRTLILCVYLGAAVWGLAGFATTVGAQNRASSPADEELKERVQAALHAAPYFYDQHVTVSVEKGAVVLRGFVFSDWDLQEAIHIADQAAGDRRVIDNLSIKQGGRR
jgi:osmotically-inducible protein OsmY